MCVVPSSALVTSGRQPPPILVCGGCVESSQGPIGWLDRWSTSSGQVCGFPDVFVYLGEVFSCFCSYSIPRDWSSVFISLSLYSVSLAGWLAGCPWETQYPTCHPTHTGGSIAFISAIMMVF